MGSRAYTMLHSRIFLQGSEDLGRALTGDYHAGLVMLSLGVAAAAAWSALLIVDRIAESVDPRPRRAWLLAGAMVLGVGIWDMHFLGMLAFELPVAVSYDVSWTLLSLAPAILGAAAALQLLSRRSHSLLRLNLAGALLGSGIGAMHYVGMAAMIAPLEMRLSFPLFLLSILVAVLLATSALYGEVRFAKSVGPPAPGRAGEGLASREIRRAAGAVILGLAVSGMHYTGMAAAVYLPAPAGFDPAALASGIRPEPLAWLVTIGTGAVLCAAVLSAIVDRRIQDVSHGLRDSERRMRLFLANVAEGIVSTSADGIITSLNPGATRILGYRPHEMLGKHIGSFIPALAGAGFPGMLAARSESSAVPAIELDARHATKGRVPVSLTLVDYAVSGQRTITGVFRDLSEERRLRSQLQQTRKMEAVGQLASGIAHEINTPTQFVGDNIGFLGDGFEDLRRALDAHARLLVAARRSGVLKEVVDGVEAALGELDVGYLEAEIPVALEQSRQGLERIASIVDAMKSFAHPGTDAKRLFDLNRAVRNTIMIARNEWEPVAEIELDLAEGLAPIPGYEAEINQVLLGLILNSAQAIAGQERSETQSPALGRILVSTRRVADTVILELVDDGPGMSEAVRQQAFEPFFSTKEVGQGTGQGLAVAWSIVVDKHHGSIELESAEGEGARFRLRLPIGEVEPEADPKPPPIGIVG